MGPLLSPFFPQTLESGPRMLNGHMACCNVIRLQKRKFYRSRSWTHFWPICFFKEGSAGSSQELMELMICAGRRRKLGPNHFILHSNDVNLSRRAKLRLDRKQLAARLPISCSATSEARISIGPTGTVFLATQIGYFSVFLLGGNNPSTRPGPPSSYLPEIIGRWVSGILRPVGKWWIGLD